MNTEASTRPAFTLVELLVVVTIIVVLLALLSPALDQAIYQAELTVCATKQRAIAQGANSYCHDYNRAYPYRAGVYATNVSTWPMNISLGTKEWDDRPKLQKYFALNATLNCPMSP